jgi:hypothetical protein
MNVTVENAAGVSSVRMTNSQSIFLKGCLNFSDCVIVGKPIVIVTTQEGNQSTAIRSVMGESHYISLSMIPKIRTKDIQSKIVFLVDSSGSMQGQPIQCVRDTLIFLTKQQPPSCYFQVIFFSSGYECLFEGSVPNTRASLSRLWRKLANLSANGGTELHDPLVFVYNTTPRSGYMRQIFILTDGQVSREANILALVARNCGAQRIFSLGIGTSIARAFIEEIATRSTGHAVFVEAGLLQTAATEQLKYALETAVASPQIEVDDAAVEIAPFPIPPLFSRTVSNVYLRMPDMTDGPVLVTGRAGSSSFEAIIEPRVVSGKIELVKFHAFMNIKDLQDKIPLASLDDARRLKGSIISLSQQSGIISDFTALFTVLEGVELNIEASLGQERFSGMQPFTQGQCRGHERFRALTDFDGQAQIYKQTLGSCMLSQSRYSKTRVFHRCKMGHSGFLFIFMWSAIIVVSLIIIAVMVIKFTRG